MKRRTAPASVSPCLAIHSVLIGSIENKSISVPVSFSVGSKVSQQIVATNALVDSGAGGKFINQNYSRKHKLEWTPLKKPLEVFNIDETPNKRGTITHKVELNLKIGDRT